MKKSLSLLVAIAMVFSMFASVAFAADNATEQTAQEKYDALVAAGIFDGMPDGEAHLDDNMTRAQAAKIIALLTGYTEGTSVPDAGYTDLVGAGWATDFINYATSIGILNGMGNNKFAPSDEVTTEQLAKMAIEALGFLGQDVPDGEAVDGTVSDWAKDYVAAAVAAGLLPSQEDYTIPATRELLVVSSYTAYEVAMSAGELMVKSVAQTGKGEITVQFNKAVTEDEAADLTYTVQNGLVKYDVTSTWADDMISVVLSSNYLPAATYTVTVGEFDAVQVTVVNEVPTKIEIGANSLQKAAGQNLKVKLYNQFDKEIESPILNVSVYNATYGKTITPGADYKVDLSSDAVARIDDNIVVTASHLGSGLTTTKSFKVVAGSSATAITLTAPAPKEGKDRISVGQDGLVLPYTLADQYGSSLTLAGPDSQTIDSSKQVVLDGITFLVNDNTIITELAVDEDGVLTFKTGVQAGTVVISALNPTTGANASISFVVAAAAKVKTFQMSNPGVIIAANEEVVIPFQAADTFDAPIAGKDVDLSQVSFNSSVKFADHYPKLNAKGELVFKFDPTDVGSDRTAYIYAYVDGAQAGQLQLDVRTEATAVKINGFDVAKYIANGAFTTVKPANITYLDSYNRTKKVSSLSDVNINLSAATLTLGAVDADGNKPLAADPSTTGKVEISIDLFSSNTDTAFKTTVEVVKASDVKSYAIKAVGTVYAGDPPSGVSADKYNKDITLVGKLSGGQEVVIKQTDAFDIVTTSNPSVVSIVDANTIAGVDAGTATVAAYKGATKLAETEVTVSKATPVATTISFDKSEYSLTDGDAALPVTVTVKDQYGVELPNAVGLLATSDVEVVSVDNGTMEIQAEGAGTATITYLTTNGATGTATVYVEAAPVVTP